MNLNNTEDMYSIYYYLFDTIFFESKSNAIF